MPKVQVEILRTVNVTRSESVVVELPVPKRVLDDCDVVTWVDQIMEKDEDAMTAQEKKVYEAVDGADWEVSDEDESVEYDEAYDLNE